MSSSRDRRELPRAGRPGKGIGAALVSQAQRKRMLEAAVEVVAEHGYAQMSVERVTSSAGLSRRTFYDLFEDREGCFLAAFDEAVARMQAVVLPAYRAPVRWREQMRGGLAALLVFLEREAAMGSLVIVGSLGADTRALARRASLSDTLIDVVDRGRAEVNVARQPPPLTAEGVIGAVAGVLHTRLLERPVGDLLGLLNPLMGMIVLPYLGQAAATRELALPVPALPPASSHAGSSGRERAEDPLEGLEMRLTYRTLRVLSAIAEHPGASNREIATLAEVSDQGQISKLLARLGNLGLIENSGNGQARGEANAWRLTARGLEVQRITHIGNV
jgi:AcrR family transcriptional regulator